jgi:tetratricopeptide (TPR) repeat protein
MRQADAGHLTREQRDRLAAGEVPDRATLREVFGHLVRGCPTCCALVAPLVRPSVGILPSPPQDHYDFPMARAITTAKADMRELDECRRLARPGVDQTLAAIMEGSLTGDALRPPPGGSPLWRWAWCEALAEAARDRSGDSLLMLLLAEHAVELSEEFMEELAQGPYLEEALADLQAKARMEYGNRLRVVENYPGAARELGEALRRSERGTRDPLLLARLADLNGSLYRAQRRIAEALRVLDLAAQLYRRYGEPHWVGRVLIKQGATLVIAGRPEEAFEVLKEALRSLDIEREPILQLKAEHNLLLALVEMGRTEEAWQRLWSARALYEEFGSPLDQFKLMGLDATIAVAQGQTRRAEKLFRDEKAGYESLGYRYPAAISSLDLAALLLEQRRPTEVPGLLDQALKTFRRLGIEREILMVLSLLCLAAKQRTATAEDVRDLARKLRHREVRERREPA